MPEPPAETTPAPEAPREAGAARNTFFAFLTQMSTAAFTAALTLYLV
ncbi:MAG: hypothetical protein QOH38_1292, partial [Thermoleophilaceae bacterium]|nr:hypothetical protein [Thermoleophilaceae bacterium]